MWVQDTRLEEEWKPSRSKFVMAWAGSRQLNITCDPGAPMAYRREPFWTALKDTAARFAADDKVIVVYTGDKKFVLLPDGERLLGPRDLFVEFRVVIEDRGGAKSYFVEARDRDGSVRRVA